MTQIASQQVYDRLSGQLLGTVLEIKGDQITYKAIGIPTFHTISACWVNVWNN